jgi:ribonuclease HI
LFIHCAFTKSVWHHIISSRQYNHSWTGTDFEDCVTKWSNNKSVPCSLAALTCWFIWLERNTSIFEGKAPLVNKVIIRSFGALHTLVEKQVSLLLRSNILMLPLEYPLASFDGASKSDGTCSGAGGILQKSARMAYKWYFNCGIGSNTKVELIGAWTTLYIANILSLNKLQILGDSKVIIDWINLKGELCVSSLEGWKQSFRVLNKSFEDLQFFHIYRELNKEADRLYKYALIAPEGIISLSSWSNGEEGPPRHIRIY